MKSVVNLAVTAAVGVLAIIGVTSFSLVYNSQTILKDVFERNIVESLNQMELIKKAVLQSVEYSTYQSVYSLSKYGGYGNYYGKCDQNSLTGLPNDLPYWKVYNTECFPNPELTFEENLDDAIHEKFLQYLDSVANKYDIITPTYDAPFIQISDDVISLSMSSTSEIKFVSGKLEISDRLNIIKDVKISLGKLISIAKDAFITNDFIPTTIEDANNDMINSNYPSQVKNCKSINFQQCGTEPTVEFVLDAYCPDAKAVFETKINDKVLDLESFFNTYPPYAGTEFSLSIKQLDSSVSGTCYPPVIEENSSSCGCMTPDCRERDTLYTVTCNYNYQADATLLVSAKDKENQYPVYDSVEGITSLRNLMLQFYVRLKNEFQLY